MRQHPILPRRHGGHAHRGPVLPPQHVRDRGAARRQRGLLVLLLGALQQLQQRHAVVSVGHHQRREVVQRALEVQHVEAVTHEAEAALDQRPQLRHGRGP